MDFSRFESIKENAHRYNAELIAVSKGQSFEKIRKAYSWGQRAFGENYAQECVEKSEQALSEGLDIQWHFLGKLQTNKIRLLTPHVYAYHSIENLKQVEQLLKFAKDQIRIFVQVNLDEEKSKAGLSLDRVEEFLEEINKIQKLEILGLMALPEKNSTTAFSRLKELSNKFPKLTRGKLSMGMSDDYELALKSGSTHVRVGSLIFGPRES